MYKEISGKEQDPRELSENTESHEIQEVSIEAGNTAGILAQLALGMMYSHLKASMSIFSSIQGRLQEANSRGAVSKHFTAPDNCFLLQLL
jgi:hypothetical protein